MHTCICVSNISNNNNSNQYIHTHMYISQIKLIIDHNHISFPISLSYYLFKDILNLCTYFMYSFMYTYSYIHSRILIHVYSFIYSFTYTHSCILIHIFLSFVIIFWLYVIIIIYNLTTLCVHDNLPSIFIFMFQFIFIFHITFMFHEHFYTFCISYIFLVSCLLHMALHILVKYDVYDIKPHSCILIPL